MLRALGAVVAITAMCLTSGVTSAAETAREIGWADLQPKEAPIDNPFMKMDMDLRYDLSTIARTRLDIEIGYIDKGGEEDKDAQALAKKLTDEGHDVDGLIALAKSIETELKRRDKLVVQDLDGKQIRMPGYALPLDFSDEGVAEFLLVPYVGACIHSPAPPRNQTVYVTLNQTYKFSSLYDAVWITGEMTIQGGKKSLSFVDGAADIDVGYTLKGVKIEPYED